jgi:FtsZ-interacting cell division protein ZipA
MSTWLIVVIVIAVVVIVALLLVMRRAAVRKRGERQLAKRRERAVTEHREAAQTRTGAAEEAEHRARLAGAVAERERAEARLHEERARAHELGLADQDLREDARDEDGQRDEDVRRDERGTVAQGAPPERGRIQNGDR